MATYYLSLNKAVLVLFPNGLFDATNDASKSSYVAQVMIVTPKSPTVGVLASFFLAQKDITRAVESLIGAHISTSLPADIILRGKGYSLKGKRQTWEYGKGLQLMWGEEKLKPCDDKWVFIFETS